MIKQPHDLLVKNFLTNVDVAADFLKAHLPQEVVSRCDFSTLRIEPTSFIEEDLRSHLADILYTLLIDGEPGLIYSIVEAESNPKPLMPLRFVRYQTSALKLYAERFKGKKLPVIIPILLYTGKRSPYPYETDFFDCFADPELARDTFFTPKLIDLSVTNDNEIMQHGKAAFLELVSKHIRDRDVLNLAYQLAELLKTHPLTRNLFRHMLNYVVSAGESESYEEFLKVIIDQTTQEFKEETMTIAEQLENRGYQKGIHAGIEQMQQGILEAKSEGKLEGKLEGKSEGVHETKIIVVKNMLANGFTYDVIEKITGLSAKEIAKFVH